MSLATHQTFASQNLSETSSAVSLLAVQPDLSFVASRQGQGLGIIDYDRLVRQFKAVQEQFAGFGMKMTIVSGLQVGDLEKCMIDDYIAVLNHDVNKDLAALVAGQKVVRYLTADAKVSARDCVKLGRKVFIGISSQTNYEGAAQLAFYLSEFGAEPAIIDLNFSDHQHLDTVLCGCRENTALVHEDYASNTAFKSVHKIIVPEAEKGILNSLYVGNILFVPFGYSQTCDALYQEKIGFQSFVSSEVEKINLPLAQCVLNMHQTHQSKTFETLQNTQHHKVAL